MVVRPVVDKEFVSISCLERECVAADERIFVIDAFVGFPGLVSGKHYSVSAAAGSASIEVVSGIGVGLKSRSAYGQIVFLTSTGLPALLPAGLPAFLSSLLISVLEIRWKFYSVAGVKGSSLTTMLELPYSHCGSWDPTNLTVPS